MATELAGCVGGHAVERVCWPISTCFKGKQIFLAWEQSERGKERERNLLVVVRLQ